jgi:hypothetical protein
MAMLVGRRLNVEKEKLQWEKSPISLLRGSALDHPTLTLPAERVAYIFA